MGRPFVRSLLGRGGTEGPNRGAYSGWGLQRSETTHGETGGPPRHDKGGAGVSFRASANGRTALRAAGGPASTGETAAPGRGHASGRNDVVAMARAGTGSLRGQRRAMEFRLGVLSGGWHHPRRDRRAAFIGMCWHRHHSPFESLDVIVRDLDLVNGADHTEETLPELPIIFVET
jgi:hypothetical protein